ncbi:hypothetical protein D3C85_1691080 [compost metagenome]
MLDQLGSDGGSIQAAVHANDDGGADCTEGDGRALYQHAENYRGQGGKANGDQQRSGDGGWSTETGGAFDETAE